MTTLDMLLRLATGLGLGALIRHPAPMAGSGWPGCAPTP
jgi:hypothetical protein